MKVVRFLFLTLLVGVSTPAAIAQEVHNESQGVWRAEVVEILDQSFEAVPGTDSTQLIQTVRADVLDGPKAGQQIDIPYDFLELKEGQRFYFRHDIYIDGSESYGVISVERMRSLMLVVMVFVAAIIWLGGRQGVRSLIALSGSIAAIFFILIPAILAGWNPVWVSAGVAAVVLFAAIFFTHGFNRESAVAYSGTMISVVCTGLFAAFAVWVTSLSGFSTDESVYLNMNTRGVIDFSALLLGAIIIGILGVLDDIAVTQAAIVTELFSSNRALSRREVFTKAMRVGREHVGALVNTLVLAYAGASLPLLLHVYLTASSVSMALNSEIFATEIVRAVVGSVGLILCVPVVTGLAVWYLKDYQAPAGRVAHHHHH